MKNRILSLLMILSLLCAVCMVSVLAAPPEPPAGDPPAGAPMTPPDGAPMTPPDGEPAGEVSWADYQAYLLNTIGAGAPDKAELQAQIDALGSWSDIDVTASPWDMFFKEGSSFFGQVMTWDDFVAAGGNGGTALDIAPQEMTDAPAEGEAPAEDAAPEAPAEPAPVAEEAGAPAAETVTVSFNIADAQTLPVGEDLVFYIGCEAPVDLGPNDAVSCTCSHAVISYSEVTLGGPYSYPTAELVTISGIDEDCSVTISYDNSVADIAPSVTFDADAIADAVALNAQMSAERANNPMPEGAPGAAAGPMLISGAPAAPAGNGPVGPATGSGNMVLVICVVCLAGLAVVCFTSKKRA